MNIVTFQKVTTGEFDVLVDGRKTAYSIVNGSKGMSGYGRNVYGIVKEGASVRWIGSLQTCKKTLTFQLTKEAH